MAKQGKAKKEGPGGRVLRCPCRGGPYGGGSVAIHCWATISQTGTETLEGQPTFIWVDRADGELDGFYRLQLDGSYHWTAAIWEAA